MGFRLINRTAGGTCRKATHSKKRFHSFVRSCSTYLCMTRGNWVKPCVNERFVSNQNATGHANSQSRCFDIKPLRLPSQTRRTPSASTKSSTDNSKCGNSSKSFPKCNGRARLYYGRHFTLLSALPPRTYPGSSNYGPSQS